MESVKQENNNNNPRNYEAHVVILASRSLFFRKLIVEYMKNGGKFSTR